MRFRDEDDSGYVLEKIDHRTMFEGECTFRNLSNNNRITFNVNFSLFINRQIQQLEKSNEYLRTKLEETAHKLVKADAIWNNMFKDMDEARLDIKSGRGDLALERLTKWIYKELP